ncbi:ferritin family protein [Geobacter sulfurreducens]|jgi:rubrerythrin|uniref:Ferritin-like domain protein n=1 Tax=Geobacter sulfurreducens (strain ATCC 51573 / DSM 12127 / PCA) TaxID=243231 RepID=Q74B48_GEOSL|nr:ferritin family protein [Geobacter sulfurreducens]AAR35569.1 ferritin-like domain protein [Geobacter sulfurreducens PCA]ADI84952.1 ferritin-like domain protein [Geobacter sulfurreducens KN400]AJY68431.1 ferritin [Geobacter sulfurreducens]QVW34052.1 ferritin family protein [Geobacter sulfurreducens]UAC02911.1 ferritin family protein [Geobacter sulfurreducens]
MNLIDCALRMEEEAAAHYSQLAAAAPVEELRSIFGLLAAAEKEHHDKLVAMLGDADAAATAFTALDDASCVFKPLLGKRDLVAELRRDPDGYRHVVKEEEESIKFYEDLAAKAEREDTRAILLKLADEERRHLSIVENIYSFIEEPKTYLAWGEFSNLKEY